MLRVPAGAAREWQESLGAELVAVLQKLRAVPRVLLLELRVGETPSVLNCDGLGGVEAVPYDATLLGRARRVELESLLRENNGVSTPADYHFRLPSGAHGSSFVRLADSIRTPRDAMAIATWLAPFIQDSTGLLTDSASMVSIATAVELLAAQAGRTLGSVVSLEQYPKNRLDTMKAVRDVDRGSNVIALVSVHSTGSLVDRVIAALNQVASSEWTLQLVVDKSGTPGDEVFILPDAEAAPLDRVATWASIGEPRDVAVDDCDACRRGPARIAQIDPRTFDGMVLPSPELLTPAADWAFRQRRLWELADRADAVTVEAASDVSSLHPRYGTDKFMSVKVNFRDLLGDEHCDATIEAAVEALLAQVEKGEIGPSFDLLLVDEREAEIDHFDELVEALRLHLGGPDVVSISNHEPIPAGVRHQISAADRILLFRLGVVSGLSLQQSLYRIQEIRRGTAPYVVESLVLHFRPQDGRIRETLENSLARRLHFLWESYLPEDRHPLQEEMDLIVTIHGDRADRVQAFLEQRLATCSGFPADGQVLWGAGVHYGDDVARLSPMSYFGEELRVRAAFAAIGSAVHRARVKAESPRSAPLWRMFEMHAIFRSYYDPIIVACILRWLRSTEVWWGDNARDSGTVLTNAIRRTNEKDQVTLVSELLLAAAQAKIPTELHEQLVEYATLLAESVGEGVDAPLQLGIALVEG
jgi:hypothetical protein